jgi:Holliday junction resolvase RusA-like endonuclease
MTPPAFDVEAMIADNGSPQDKTVYIHIKGPPMVQQRHRIRVLPAGRRHFIYDPSHQQKRACKQALRQALSELGITQFPVYPGHNLKFIVKMNFYLHNHRKDNDNLEKFAMDMMESIIYYNDRQIYDNITKKRVVAESGEYSEIEIQEIVGL